MKTRWFAVIKVLPIVVLVLLAALCVTAGCGSSSVAVPKVTGLTVQNARAQLEQSAFKAEIVYSNQAKGQQGIVIGQNPKVDTKAKKGTTVTITVTKQAAGQAPATAPSSSGTTPTSNSGTTPTTGTDINPTSGQQTHKVEVTCSECGGKGFITTTVDEQVLVVCPKCNGTGQISGQPCPQCGGTGKITQTKQAQKQETCPKCGGAGYIWVEQ